MTAPWTLTACRERAAYSLPPDRGSWEANMHVDRAELLALVDQLEDHLTDRVLEIGAMLSLVDRIRAYLGHRRVALPGKPPCALLQNDREDGPVACDCGLAELQREMGAR